MCSQVDVQLERQLRRPLLLDEIKRIAATPNHPLSDMALLKQSRLSVSPLTDSEWLALLELELNNVNDAAKSLPQESLLVKRKILSVADPKKKAKIPKSM